MNGLTQSSCRLSSNPFSTCDNTAADAAMEVLNAVFAAALIVLIAIMSVGCGRRDIVASVDGEAIYRDEFEVELLKRAGEHVLREIITERLIRREAERKGISVSRSEVDAEIKRRQLRQGDKASLEELKREVELSLLLRKLCMSDPQATPSTHEVISYYESHKDEFTIPERVKLRCIVADDLSSAMSIYDAVMRAKDSFAELACKLSVDEATKDKGGDMGILIVRNLSPKLRAVVEGMSVGDVSKPFELDGRWWIIKLEGRMPARQQSIDDVRVMISQMLREQKAQALQPIYIRRLWERARVEVYIPELSKRILGNRSQVGGHAR